MKYGMAEMVEIATVLREAGVQLPGDILFSAHEWHESTEGNAHGMRSLIANGYVGDAVIVLEGPKDECFIAGRSNGRAEITFTLQGESIHELSVGRDTPNLLEIGARAMLRLTELQARIRSRRDPVLGPESLFLSMVHAGDYPTASPPHKSRIRRSPRS